MFISWLFLQAAYRDNTLGLPKICPPENIEVIDKSILHTYLHTNHSPDKMVLAGVGIEHQALVDAAKKHFLSREPVWETSGLVNKSAVRDDSYAQYTGGIVQVSYVMMMMMVIVRDDSYAQYTGGIVQVRGLVQVRTLVVLCDECDYDVADDD